MWGIKKSMPYTCWVLWWAYYIEDFTRRLHFQCGVVFRRVVLREVYFEGPNHVWRTLKTQCPMLVGFLRWAEYIKDFTWRLHFQCGVVFRRVVLREVNFEGPNHVWRTLKTQCPTLVGFLRWAYYIEDFAWRLHFQCGVVFRRVVLREVYFEGPNHVWRTLNMTQCPMLVGFLRWVDNIKDFTWRLHFQCGVAFWRIILREVYFVVPNHVWRTLKTSILNTVNVSWYLACCLCEIRSSSHILQQAAEPEHPPALAGALSVACLSFCGSTDTKKFPRQAN